MCSLSLVEQLRRLPGSGRFGRVGGYRSQDRIGVGMVDDEIRCGCHLDGLACEFDGVVLVALGGEHLGKNRSCGDPRLWRLSSECIAHGGQVAGLVELAKPQERSGEVRSRMAGVGVDSQVGEAGVGLAQRRLCGSRLAGQQLDDARVQLRSEDLVTQAQLLHGAAGLGHHRACGVEAATQRLQDGLAASRHRFHSR